MKIPVICIGLLFLFSCESEEFDAEAWIAKGRETVAPFKMQMQSALEASLLGGVQQQIEVCRVTAPAIAKALSVKGVTIGRTSHRLRNRDNAPREWQQAFLDKYRGSTAALSPSVVRLSATKVGYIEPIYAKPICLKCHGSQIRSEVSAQLARFYPDDHALGFKADEFRGLIWVEFDTAAME